MISSSNFILLAMKCYDNPTCKTIEEFKSDVTKFTLLNRVISKDISKIQTELILNTVIGILNNFSSNVAISLMFYKTNKEYHHRLKTILVYLNRMPDSIPDLNILSENIQLCQPMFPHLREI